MPYLSQVFILEELLSPVITPFILIFCLRRKSLEIIDFFRNFTVEVVGVGDTCSFAQMDVRQHGHPAVRAHTARAVDAYIFCARVLFGCFQIRLNTEIRCQVDKSSIPIVFIYLFIYSSIYTDKKYFGFFIDIEQSMLNMIGWTRY